MNDRAISVRLRARWDDIASAADGTVSVALHAAGRPVAARLESQPHYAASTMKLAVLGAALRAMECDPQLGAERLELRAAFTGLSGPFLLSASDDQDPDAWARLGARLTVAELLGRMISLSSNIATDVVLERIGLPAVAEYLCAVGLEDQLRIERAIGDLDAELDGHTNTVTASGLARLMEHLLDGSHTPASTMLAWRALVAQQHRGMIPAGLPPEATAAGKSGWVAGVKHDVAVVDPGNAPRYLLAVCTTVDLDDDLGEALVAEVSRASWEEWIGWHG